MSFFAYKAIADGIRSFLIPFPPLPEQHRILHKVKQLNKISDELEHTIQRNQMYTQNLLQVTLKEVLATESKNGRDMDQVQHPENGTNLDLDIDIDIYLQNENDFFEDLYYADDQYEEQCKLDYEFEWLSECQYNVATNPTPNERYQKYDDYSSLMHGLYEHMPVDCAAIRMSWSNLLIYKSNNEFFYYYSVYDTSKKETEGSIWK